MREGLLGRWFTVVLWLFAAAGLLRNIEGDHAASAVWACGIVLLLILRELVGIRDDAKEREPQG